MFAEMQKDEVAAGSPKYKAVLTYEDILKTVRYLVRLHASARRATTPTTSTTSATAASAAWAS